MRVVYLALLLASMLLGNADPVVTRIAHVDYFAFGGIGFAGRISQGEKDYKQLLSRPSAETDFEAVFIAGNPQAKAYALSGIHQLDGAKFKELTAPLLDSKTEVKTITGCIISHTTLAKIIESIQR
jgi:hypothetical protein